MGASTTSVDLSALFDAVQSAITSNLPSILTVAAIIIGVTVVVRLFKRIAR